MDTLQENTLFKRDILIQHPFYIFASKNDRTEKLFTYFFISENTCTKYIIFMNEYSS